MRSCTVRFFLFIRSFSVTRWLFRSALTGLIKICETTQTGLNRVFQNLMITAVVEVFCLGDTFLSTRVFSVHVLTSASGNVAAQCFGNELFLHSHRGPSVPALTARLPCVQTTAWFPWRGRPAGVYQAQTEHVQNPVDSASCCLTAV